MFISCVWCSFIKVSLGSGKAQFALESGFWTNKTVGPLKQKSQTMLSFVYMQLIIWQGRRRMQLNIQNDVLNRSEQKKQYYQWK